MPAPRQIEGENDVVTLNIDAFDKLLADLGITSNLAAADLFQCGQGTIWRLRNGKIQPGRAFITRLKLKLPQIEQQLGRSVALEDLIDFAGDASVPLQRTAGGEA